jgi:hypothetical protein
MSDGVSMRRVLLGTIFVLLVLLDASAIYRALEALVVGHLFSPLGLGGLGVAMALVQVPVILGLVWLTVVVWNALQRR